MKTACRQSGFSLLEILVAFSILALSLGVLLRVFSVNIQLAALTDDYSKAVMLAESQLAEATAKKLEESESQGEFGDRFKWTVSIKSYNPDIEELDLNSLSVSPYQIDVKVEWGPDSKPRNLTLTTLRLQGKT